MKQATTPASAKPSKAAAKPVATGGRAKGTRRRIVRQDGPDPIDVHVGARMHERRVMLGMSLTALAGKLGITFQQVQKYEKGVNRIGASRLFDLAHVLGVPVQFFYEEAPSTASAYTGAIGMAERPESYMSESLGSRDGLELNKAFSRIADPKIRRSIVDLVRSISGEDADKPSP